MVTQEKFLKDLKKLLVTDQDISMEMDLLDIESWDSLSAISFLSMAEKEYGITIEPYEVAEAIFVEDLYNIVVK